MRVPSHYIVLNPVCMYALYASSTVNIIYKIHTYTKFSLKETISLVLDFKSAHERIKSGDLQYL